MQTEFTFEAKPVPLVVCCGLGVDSVAMLVLMQRRGIRPDLIVFADVGAERQATYDYLPVLNTWLVSVGFPEVVVVRYVPKNFKHWPPYHTLEENLLTNVTLPSIAYGSHTCSAKWKIAPIQRYVDGWRPARECWASGRKVRKAIGFESSPHELRRATRACGTFAIDPAESERFDLWFPLQEWGFNREACEGIIELAGLPVPQKSSCYFCTAMKPHEVETLEADKLRRIVIIEARTAKRHLGYAEAKGWPRGDGVPLTEGLWRKRVKGMRGATPKPGAMTDFIRERALLPADEIRRLIEATPTEPVSAEQMEGGNWQTWLADIMKAAQA